MKHQIKSGSMKFRSIWYLFPCFVFAYLFCFVGESQAVSFTFDGGFDGWSPTQPSETSWTSSGGNPNGYIRFVDSSANGSMILAPSAYLGDWSGFEGTGVISFDHKMFSTGNSITQILDYEIIISGSGNTARWSSPAPNTITDWVTLSAPIVESFWDVTGSWSSLLTSIDELRIRIELVDGPNDIAGIDNIFLPDSAPVPEPATMLLFGTGIFGLAGARFRWKKK